jgi:prephenate dehydratase
VFDSVVSGRADFGVLPIENSVVGSIYENYDLLDEYDLKIISEHYTKIQHCLLVDNSCPENTDQALSQIKKVLSHPKALEQCSHFFREHPWISMVVHMDTAGAAEEVAQSADPSIAAIASSYAGDLYGLRTLKTGIENDPQNYTRFVTIAKKRPENASPLINKCSLVFELPHTPGSLANLLQQFSKLGVNLTKIESRPVKGSLFEYLFYLDFEFVEKNAILLYHEVEEIGSHVPRMKILGWYQKGST